MSTLSDIPDPSMIDSVVTTTTTNTGDEEDPLTKAKLFTVASDDGSWTEIGLGAVSIRFEDDEEDKEDDEDEERSEDHQQTTTSGTTPTTTTTARMDVLSLEDKGEVLMSTPLVVDDIYVVQHGSILVWSDPEIGRDMALSFNCVEGCKAITDKIMEFQAMYRNKSSSSHTAASTAAPSGDGEDKTPQQLARGASGASSSGDSTAQEQQSPWAVCRENLPTIVLAVQNNHKRFGMYVRDHERFSLQLAKLFLDCEAQCDVVGREHIGRIVVSLLSPPFNTEGRILSQLIDNDVIDTTIDIVQFALGRRSKETGFVDTESRKGTFRNPCHLPQVVVNKIHVLQSVQFLKDMLPLLLDEGDAAGSSLLGVFLLRFKFGLVGELCRSDNVLPEAFQSPLNHQSLSTLRVMVAFLHDLSKTIKNAMIPMDPKEELYEELLGRGVLEYARRVMIALLEMFPMVEGNGTEQGEEDDHQPQQEVCDILAMLCDIVSHMAMFLPRVRDDLVTDAWRPEGLTSGFARRLNFVSSEDATPLWKAMVAAQPDSSDRMLDVMMSVAAYCACACHTMAAQSAYDMLFSCGVGMLQGSVLQSLGVNIHPKRRQLLRHWVEGPPRSASAHAAFREAVRATTAASRTTKVGGVADADTSCAEGKPEAVDVMATSEGELHWPPLYKILSAIGKLSADMKTIPLMAEASSTSSTTNLRTDTATTSSSQPGCSSSSSSLTSGGSTDSKPEGSAISSMSSTVPFHLEAVTIINNSSSTNTCDSTTSAAAPRPSSQLPSPMILPHQFMRKVHYLVKFLIPLSKESTIVSHGTFAPLLQASGALRTVKIALSYGGGGGVATNTQATCLSWLSVLVQSMSIGVLECIYTSEVLGPAVQHYLTHFGRRSGGGCILGSVAAALMNTIHHSVHLRKSEGGSCNNSKPSSPSLHHQGTPSNSSMTTNPFLRSLGRGGSGEDSFDKDSSGSNTLGGEGASSSQRNVADTCLVSWVLEKYGALLRLSPVAAHKALAATLQRVLDETPEEAAHEEASSSRAASTVDRVVISDGDFNALLSEYGPDAPIPEAMLEDVVGEGIGGTHGHHHLHNRSLSPTSSSGGDDDEETALKNDVGGEGKGVEEDVHNDGQAGEEEQDADSFTPEHAVGFLLRRTATLRKKRSRSPLASQDDDDEEEDGSEATHGSVNREADEVAPSSNEDKGEEEPATKAARVEREES